MTVRKAALIVLASLVVLGTSVASPPAPSAQPADALSVASPGGGVVISFAVTALPQPYAPGERAYYRVTFRGVPVLADSPLGIDFAGAPALDAGFEIAGTARRSVDATWTNPFGPRRVVPDRYNELTVTLRERTAPGRLLDVVFRAYDEGAAFRYVLPEQGGPKPFTIAAEETGFRFAREAAGYVLNMGKFNTHNEGEYVRTPLRDVKPASIFNLPLLLELEGGPWAALLEADLADYAGMYVGGVAAVPNALVAKLSVPPGRKAEEAVVGTTPKATPWRVVMVADDPGRLIESNDLLMTLSAPCAIADTSWIKPGRAAWDWWSGSFARNVGFAPGMNTATMKHYVDFAAAHGFEYMLVDAGWTPPLKGEAVDRFPLEDVLHYVPEVDIPGIISYAAGKGVKTLLWVEWRSLDKVMGEAMALYEKWGAAGIKVDYMNRDDQEMVNYYERVARTAAAHRLTVDYHGAFKGTGTQRTWPNVLTREGVMGMEYNKWSERITPVHNLTIPFTRMLAGAMDFTPGGFRNAAKGKFEVRDVEPMTQGTRAHQLAMYIVYESPLVMVSDHPEAYEKQPGIEFIEKVPTVWDETRVLQGRPAEFIAMARRSGAAWYVGAMTSWDPRDLAIPTTFLGKGRFDAWIFADGPAAATDGTSLSVAKTRVKAGEPLTLRLAPGGGAAVILTPSK